MFSATAPNGPGPEDISFVDRAIERSTQAVKSEAPVACSTLHHVDDIELKIHHDGDVEAGALPPSETSLVEGSARDGRGRCALATLLSFDVVRLDDAMWS